MSDGVVEFDAQGNGKFECQTPRTLQPNIQFCVATMANADKKLGGFARAIPSFAKSLQFLSSIPLQVTCSCSSFHVFKFLVKRQPCHFIAISSPA